MAINRPSNDPASSGILSSPTAPRARDSAKAPAARDGASSGLLMSSAEGRSSGVLSGPPPASRTSSAILSSAVLQSSGLLAGPISPGPDTPQPLSVTHVGPCMFRGGAEQQLIDLARFLNPQRAVLRECLVTMSDGIDPAVARDLPCPVRPAGRAEIAHAIQHSDVVLCWGLEFDQWADPVEPRRAVTIHVAHGDSPWTRELLLAGRRTVDHAVAVSRRVLDTTCTDFPATLILNGVDTARLATTRPRTQVRAELGFRPEDFVVGFVGRFSPEKQPDLLIRVLAQLPPRFKGLFIGWGAMQPELLKQANELIPNRFAFRFADHHLGDYYQAFEALTLLSVSEGFALVFLEGMFCGLPVVATPVGAAPEIIQSQINGILVDGSVDSVRGALLQLADHPRWAAALGQTAREFAMQHGHARRMAEEYEALFVRLVAERRSRS